MNSSRRPLKKGKALGIADVSSALYDAAVGGNVTAMIFYLKNRSPDSWRDKPDSTNDDNAPPPVKVVIEVRTRASPMPSLNQPQARFLALPHKFRAFVAGFGSGKTW